MKSVKELIKESQSYDKDIKIMAANDLCMISYEKKKIDQEILQIFLNQLDESSIDLQGNSVKCICQVLTIMDQQQMKILIEKVFENKQNIQDIYVTLIKKIMEEINIKETKMIEIICEQILANLKRKLKIVNDNNYSNNESVQLALILDLFTVSSMKFRQIYQQQGLVSNYVELESELLNVLEKSKDQFLIKQSSNAIIQLLTTYQSTNQNIFITVLYQNIQKLIISKQYLFSLTIFNTVLQLYSKLLTINSTHIYQFFVTHIIALTSQELQQDIEYEILEALINNIQWCIEDKENENKDLILKLINYDPYQQIEYLNEQQQQQQQGDDDDDYDQYYDYYDYSDQSWKIRKAGVKLITRIKNLDGLIDSLLQRIMEKNWGVREATYSSLTKYFLKQQQGSNEWENILEKAIELMESNQEIQKEELELVSVLQGKDKQGVLYLRLAEVAMQKVKQQAKGDYNQLVEFINILTRTYHSSYHVNMLFDSLVELCLQSKYLKLQLCAVKLLSIYLLNHYNHKLFKELLNKLNFQLDQDFLLSILNLLFYLLTNAQLQNEHLFDFFQIISNSLLSLKDQILCISKINLSFYQTTYNHIFYNYFKSIIVIFQENMGSFNQFIFQSLLASIYFSNENLNQQDVDFLARVVFEKVNNNEQLEILIRIQELLMRKNKMNSQEYYMNLNNFIISRYYISDNYQKVIIQMLNSDNSKDIEQELMKRFKGKQLAKYECCLYMNNVNKLIEKLKSEDIDYNLEVILELIKQKNNPALNELIYIYLKETRDTTSISKQEWLNRISAQLILNSNFQLYSDLLGNSSIDNQLLIYLNLVQNINSFSQYQQYQQYYLLIINHVLSLSCQDSQIKVICQILVHFINYHAELLLIILEQLTKNINIKLHFNVLEQILSNTDNIDEMLEIQLLDQVLNKYDYLEREYKVLFYRIFIKQVKKDRGKVLDKFEIKRVFNVLCKDIQKNDDLVQVLNLGPFQHIVDQGVQIRMICYQLVSTFVSCFTYEQLERVFTQTLTDFLLSSLNDSNEDVVQAGLEMITLILNLNYTQLIQQQISIVLDILDQILTKQAKGLGRKQEGDNCLNFIKIILNIVFQIFIKTNQQLNFHPIYLNIHNNSLLFPIYSQIANQI